jgi:hypothetical protein
VTVACLATEKPAPAGRLKLISSASVPVRTIGLHQLGLRAAIVLGVAPAIAPSPVLAEMQVSGTPQAVRIDARDAPLEEILAGLSRAFGVHYQLSVNLNKRLSGTYEGSLPQVLTGVLNGYNFILYRENGAMAVTVSGMANTPGTSSGPASSSTKVVLQPSRTVPSAQAPVSSSGVEDVARKRPPSLLESVASGATAPAPPPQPRPATAALQPQPSTQAAPQWRPSTQAAPQWRPSTQAPPQPKPSTATPQPRPSTAVPQMGPFTGLPP